jgi:hypothetical protein
LRLLLLGIYLKLSRFLDDVRALAKVYGKLVTNNGRDYMHIDDVKLNFVVQSASYEVEDDKSPLLSMTF